MASLGHIAVGFAASRSVRSTWGPPSGGPKWLTAALFWSVVSFLPDADVIGFSFGVRYEDEWGHRGATHSIVFALAVGALIGALAPRFRFPAVRTGITAALVLLSHGLLDTLTDGGLGIALFWPFDQTRYFAPWRPIPVSPIGLGFFSFYGMVVALTEVVVFAPLWWYGVKRSFPLLLIAIWVPLVWLVGSTDPLRERVVAAVLRDGTEFTPVFSEIALRQVDQGQTEAEVRARLGAPFFEFMLYPAADGGCAQIRIDDGVVAGGFRADACSERGITEKLPRARVVEILGAPESSCWVYSRGPGGGFFRARGVCFSRGQVDEIVRRWIRD